MQRGEGLREEKRHGWKRRRKKEAEENEFLQGGSGSLGPEDAINAETRLAVQSERVDATVAALADSWERGGAGRGQLGAPETVAGGKLTIDTTDAAIESEALAAKTCFEVEAVSGHSRRDGQARTGLTTVNSAEPVQERARVESTNSAVKAADRARLADRSDADANIADPDTADATTELATRDDPERLLLDVGVVLLELELLVAELFEVELLRVLVEHLAVEQEDVGVLDVRDRDLLVVLDLERLCGRYCAAESVPQLNRDPREGVGRTYSHRRRGCGSRPP